MGNYRFFRKFIKLLEIGQNSLTFIGYDKYILNERSRFKINFPFPKKCKMNSNHRIHGKNALYAVVLCLEEWRSRIAAVHRNRCLNGANSKA